MINRKFVTRAFAIFKESPDRSSPSERKQEKFIVKIFTYKYLRDESTSTYRREFRSLRVYRIRTSRRCQFIMTCTISATDNDVTITQFDKHFSESLFLCLRSITSREECEIGKCPSSIVYLFSI